MELFPSHIFYHLNSLCNFTSSTNTSRLLQDINATSAIFIKSNFKKNIKCKTCNANCIKTVYISSILSYKHPAFAVQFFSVLQKLSVCDSARSVPAQRASHISVVLCVVTVILDISSSSSSFSTRDGWLLCIPVCGWIR